MSKYYKMPRKYNRMRKYNGKCEGCGEKTDISEIYQRQDESNIAISWHAPYLCKRCYENKPISMQ